MNENQNIKSISEAVCVKMGWPMELIQKASRENWRPFIICMKASEGRVSITNLGEKEEAQMLAKFAKRAKKRLQGEREI